MKKILVNARCLTKFVSGIGRYTFELLDSMAEADKNLLFMLDREPTGFFANLLERENIITVRETEFGLPDNYDVYWTPVPRTPLLNKITRPIVVTVHDLTHIKFPQTMSAQGRLGAKIFFDRAIKSADRLTCISKSTKLDLCKIYSVSQESIEVVYPIVNFKGRSSHSLISSPYVLFVGTFEPRKNLSKLLYAFKLYKQKGDYTVDAKLVLAGSRGWGRVDIEQQISACGLSSEVKIFESPNEATLQSLYQHCSFVALPSKYEGFGIPILEGLKFQKPILTSNKYSMPEVAGNAGLFVCPDSIEEISEGIHSLLHIKSVFDEKVHWAKIEEKRFSRYLSSKKMLEVFNTVL